MRQKPLLALGIALAVVGGCGGTGARNDGAEGLPGEALGEQITPVWQTSWDQAFELARADNRLVVVDFHADWSAWSVHMTASVLQEPALARVLAETSVPLRLDVEDGHRGWARQHRIEHLPTVLIFSSDGAELERLVGVRRPADIVDAIARASRRAGPIGSRSPASPSRG